MFGLKGIILAFSYREIGETLILAATGQYFCEISKYA